MSTVKEEFKSVKLETIRKEGDGGGAGGGGGGDGGKGKTIKKVTTEEMKYPK